MPLSVKICTKCHVEQPVTNFAKMSRAKDGLQHQCKTCNNAFAKQNYHDNKERYFAGAKARDDDIRARVDTLKSKPCADCGGTFDPVCMDFDHLPGKGKVMDITAMKRHRFAWSKIEAEIAKCEVVCSNCHRLRTKMRRLDGDF